MISAKWARRLAGLSALVLAGCGDCGSCGGSNVQAAPPVESTECCSEGACVAGACTEGSECPLTSGAVAKEPCCPASGRASAIAAASEENKTEVLAVADEEPKKAADLKVGDAAPAFEATDEQGKAWKSNDHVGKKIVVVYFYPADFTGGCTKQACSFRDDFQKLADKGVEVVGVSGDSAKTHALFKKHHKLTFTLLADEEGNVAKKFGVPVNPGKDFSTKIDGQDYTFKRGVTISRWTFVIGKDGKIAHKNTKVNAAADSQDVLKVVEGLGK